MLCFYSLIQTLNWVWKNLSERTTPKPLNPTEPDWTSDPVPVPQIQTSVQIQAPFPQRNSKPANKIQTPIPQLQTLVPQIQASISLIQTPVPQSPVSQIQAPVSQLQTLAPSGLNDKFFKLNLAFVSSNLNMNMYAQILVLYIHSDCYILVYIISNSKNTKYNS